MSLPFLQRYETAARAYRAPYAASNGETGENRKDAKSAEIAKKDTRRMLGSIFPLPCFPLRPSRSFGRPLGSICGSIGFRAGGSGRSGGDGGGGEIGGAVGGQGGEEGE